MKTFLRTILYGTLISLMIYSVIAIFVLFTTGSLEMSFIQAPESAAGLAYGFFLYIAGSSTGILLNRVLPNNTKPIIRILIYILFSCIYVPIIIFLINYVVSVLWQKIPFQTFIDQENWFSYIPLTIISLLIGLFVHGFYYYKIYKNKQIAEQEKIAGAATAQLETLKNQIDPHFLFNSLNVLIGLIEEDQSNAISYTKSLSKIYRYILEHKDRDLVLFREELDFAQNYISLLELRFEDAIQFTNHISVVPDKLYTVPLALQLILENCIQHNKASTDSPLHIAIYFEGAYLVVENNIQEKAIKTDSTKIGLKNIQDRYKLIGNQEIEILKTGEKFIVKLPILYP